MIGWGVEIVGEDDRTPVPVGVAGLLGPLIPAAALYASAERALTASGYPRMAAESRYGLGRAALARGDRQQARHHWKLALATLEAIGAADAATVRHALDWLSTGTGSFDPDKPLWISAGLSPGDHAPRVHAVTPPG